MLDDTEANAEEAATSQGAKLDAAIDPAAVSREWLPEKMRDDPAFKGLNSAEDLATAYANNVNTLENSFAEMPTEKLQALMRRHGVPETPDKYDLALDDVPEGTFDEEFAKAFRDTAHKVGVLPNQVQALARFYADDVKARAELSVQQKEQSIQAGIDTTAETLGKLWGAALTDKLTDASAAIANLGPDKVAMLHEMGALVRDPSDDKVVLANPVIGELLADYGAARRERSAVMGNAARPMTPEAARKSIDDLKHNKEFVKKLVGTEGASLSISERENWNNLYKMAYGDA